MQQIGVGIKSMDQEMIPCDLVNASSERTSEHDALGTEPNQIAVGMTGRN